jgi:hypothetical protein
MSTTKWVKSTFCSDAACVEVAPLSDGVAVRDGKNRRRTALKFERPGWDAFLDGVRRGEFEAL